MKGNLLRACACGCLLVSAIPGVALANGGPVKWSSASGAGDVGPVAESRVELVSEDLHIKLDPDGSRYHVSAHYALKNDGAPIDVAYGVPLFWYPPDLGDEDDGSARKLTTTKELQYPAGVVIQLGGRRYPCELKDVHLTPSGSEQIPDRVDAWCMANIQVPSGAADLSLEYVGSFEFIDMAYSKSAFTQFDQRQFHYALSPAGYWAGHPSLSVTVDTGRWNGLFSVTSPAGFETRGALQTYRADTTDLRKLAVIAGNLHAQKVLMSEERIHFKVDHPYGARASSQHAATGKITYSATNVLDTDEHTAWCASARANPVGQWIEVSTEPFELPSYCALEGYVVAPGYTKSQTTWMSNSRAKTVRLGPCGDSKAGSVVNLRPEDNVDAAAVEVPPYPGDDFKTEAIVAPATPTQDEKRRVSGHCTRLTIDAVIPGKAGDMCIAKFKPVVNCG